MITSIDAEAQVKAIADTHLSWILRRYSMDDVLNNNAPILEDFIAATLSPLEPLGAAIEVARGGGLNLGNALLSIDASFDARSRRELAKAIRSTNDPRVQASVDE
jgi:hypothetical protein